MESLPSSALVRHFLLWTKIEAAASSSPSSEMESALWTSGKQEQPALLRIVKAGVQGGGHIAELLRRSDSDALNVWRADEEVDALCGAAFRELLTYMMEGPRNVTFCIHLLFCAKNIERMGDHATNIAEAVHYIVCGTPFFEQRPKGDITTSISPI